MACRKQGNLTAEVMDLEPNELPLGMGMALAQDTAAMERFAALPEEEKRAVIDGAHAVRSKAEMRAYLHETLGTQG